VGLVVVIPVGPAVGSRVGPDIPVAAIPAVAIRGSPVGPAVGSRVAAIPAVAIRGSPVGPARPGSAGPGRRRLVRWRCSGGT